MDKLLKNERVWYARIDEKYIAICDGFKFYVYPENELKINLEFCVENNQIAELVKQTDKDVALENTGVLKKNRNGYLCKLSGEGINNVYVNHDFIKTFKDCNFYAFSPQNRVIVKNYYGITIAVILPCRVNPNEEF